MIDKDDTARTLKSFYNLLSDDTLAENVVRGACPLGPECHECAESIKAVKLYRNVVLFKVEQHRIERERSKARLLEDGK